MRIGGVSAPCLSVLNLQNTGKRHADEQTANSAGGSEQGSGRCHHGRLHQVLSE